MTLHIKGAVNGLPAEMRESLIRARKELGWSQAELGKRLGLPQMHISGIENGRVTPRYDTVLDLVRVLGYDLLLVPRGLVPGVQSLVRNPGGAPEEEKPLYLPDEEEEVS